jgi:hypothetical protein
MRAYLIPFLFLALGATCGAQTTLTKPNAVDLNGNWRDQNGQSVTIKQTGNQVTLTTAAGRVFSGKLDGVLLELRHDLTPAETEQDLPPPVREQAFGQVVMIKSVVSPDGNEIKGQYIGKKPRWEEKDVNGQQSYTILGWDDVPDESLFNRNGYYISELSIDYYGWQHAHNDLQNAVNDAQTLVNIRTAAFTDAAKALTAERAKMLQIAATLDAKSAALKLALAKANATTMPASMKNADYTNTQNQITKLQARQAKLEAYFDQIHNGTSSGDPQAISNLFTEHDENAATLATLQAHLQKLQDQSGFTAKVAAAQTAAQQADDDYFDAYKADAHERDLFDTAQQSALRAQQGLDDATTAFYAATANLTMFDQQGSPRIVGVRVGSYYSVTYWTPQSELADIDASIAVVKARISELDQNRQDDQALFLSAGQTALNAGQTLAGKQTWYGGSAIGQALIETGFYAWDVNNAWSKGGPPAALGEAVKKLVEGLILGFPSNADPDVSQTDIDAVFDKARDAMLVTVQKRVVKTGTGYGTGVAVTALMKSQEEKALAAASSEIEAVLNSGGTVQDALVRRYVYQRTFRDQAVENFNKAVKDGTFRKMGANLASKMIIGVVKDIAKAQMKQQVANFFVSQAFLDYIDADLQCRGAALILLKDNARYYAAQDDLVFLQQLKAEILRQYDSRNQMKVIRNQTFYDQAALPIELDNQGTNANPTANVALGGKDATPSGAALRYTVSAYELQKTADGGLKLEIHVQ